MILKEDEESEPLFLPEGAGAPAPQQFPAVALTTNINRAEVEEIRARSCATWAGQTGSAPVPLHLPSFSNTHTTRTPAGHSEHAL